MSELIDPKVTTSSSTNRKDSLFDKAVDVLEDLTKQGLHPNVLKDFKKGVINYSESSPLGPILYWCNDAGGCPIEIQNKIKELEKSNDKKVFHVTHEQLPFGECWSFYMIHKDDKKADIEKLKQGIAYGYVYNVSCPEFSESGGIGFRVHPSGGIQRTA